MLKKFFKDSFLYTLATFLTKGIGFILLPIYTRLLSPSEYGEFDYIIAIGALVAISVSLEISQSVFRLLPEYRENKKKCNQIISAAAISLTTSYLTFLLLVIIFAEHLSILLFGSVSKVNLVYLSGLLFFLNGFVNLINCIYRSRLESKKSVYFSFISAILTAIFSYVLLVYYELGVLGLVLGQVLSAFIVSIIGFINIKSTFQFDFDNKTLKEMLSFSLPIIPSSLGVILSMFADRLMIKEYLDFQQLGIYGVALRVASVITLISIGARSALSPLIYTHFKKIETPKVIRNIYIYYLALSVILILMLIFFSNFLVGFIAPSEYKNAQFIIPILASAVVIGNMYIFFPGLVINKKTGLISIINLFSGAINIGLNLVLIPKHGIYGAAIATLASSTIAFVIQYHYSQKSYKIPIYNTVVYSILVSLILLVCFWAV